MNTSAFKEIPISNITIPEDRTRTLNDSWVEILAESISEQGLLNPITVRTIKGGFELISGHHRLAAMKIIATDETNNNNDAATITAHIRDYGDKDADHIRLEEISENVIRNELNALDRARSLYELDAVYKRIYPEMKIGGNAQVSGEKNRTAILAVRSELMEKVGLSERSMQRAIAIWKGLSVASRARITGTWLADHQAQLTAFATLEKTDQGKVLDLLFADNTEFKTVDEALDHLAGKKKPSANDILYRSAIGNLGRMTPTLRATVFDTFEDEIKRHIKKRGWV